MVRYRSDGTLSWATRAVSDPESEARDVTFDPAGALLTTGFFYGELVLGEEPAAVSLAGSGTSFNDRDGFRARFTVHESEPDPAEQVAAVQDTLAGMAVHHGIANALNSKLTSALAALQRGDTPGACGPWAPS